MSTCTSLTPEPPLPPTTTTRAASGTPLSSYPRGRELRRKPKVSLGFRGPSQKPPKQHSASRGRVGPVQSSGLSRAERDVGKLEWAFKRGQEEGRRPNRNNVTFAPQDPKASCLCAPIFGELELEFRAMTQIKIRLWHKRASRHMFLCGARFSRAVKRNLFRWLGKDVASSFNEVDFYNEAPCGSPEPHLEPLKRASGEGSECFLKSFCEYLLL